MDTEIIRDLKKKNLWLLFLAILIVMLNVFLPLVSFRPATQDQYYNFESMQDSNYVELNSLSDYIRLINILLLAAIIMGFISFLGLIIRVSEKAKKISNLFIISSIVNFGLIGGAFLYFIYFVLKANGAVGIYLGFIHPSLILLLILFIVSLYYTFSIVRFIESLLERYKKKKENKSKALEEDISKKIKKAETLELQENKPVKKPIRFKIDDDTNGKIISDDLNQKEDVISKEDEEIENNKKTDSRRVKDFFENKKRQDVEEKQENIIEDEKTDDNIKPFENPQPFSKKNEESKDLKTETNIADEKVSDSFEKALEYAINKKKTGVAQKQEKKSDGKEKKTISESKDELKKEISKEMTKNKESIISKFNVKCPKCGNIFEAEKKPEGTTRIKCPSCGKEGIVK